MDDAIKITNDKRHRSSSSLVGGIEATRSERKLDIRASIPEVDDQFANAEARCEDLQEKIDLVKSLRKKKKLKKRSMTTIVEPAPGVENVPFISVRAQPKKKVSQQAARLRRLEVPQRATKPIRGYLDPDIIEQQQMLGRVHGFKQTIKPPIQNKVKPSRQNLDNISLPKSRQRRARADGDGKLPMISNLQATATSGRSVQIDIQELQQEVACGNDDDSDDYQNENTYDLQSEIYSGDKERHTELQQSKQSSGSRRRHVPRENVVQQINSPRVNEARNRWRGAPMTTQAHRPKSNFIQDNTAENMVEVEARSVVELFNKNRMSPIPWQRPPSGSTTGEKNKPMRGPEQAVSDEDVMATGNLGSVKAFKTKKAKGYRHSKYQSRRYEMPTVSSKMKEAGMRCYYSDSNKTNIPFVVSKTTAPSHNVGVNLQQVLNGLKVQQPLSGIPLTIAHHMGLRHDPSYGSKSATMATLRNSEINVIKLGGRLLRLPSYKHISYNRLLALYREGDGIVSRFLRANSRPHYFYTSMYNLATNREDFDACTSKGRISNWEAKRSLAEYADLYREYEKTEKSLNQNYTIENERRRGELAKELAAREDYIRKVMQDFKPGEERPLRATASTAEEAYRHSSFKVHDDE
ncbi:uncharacterized protein LOC116777785 isoform X3 [Danaus plexippus]|uniref:uncharacterized protein LOC116777785 isoform X3 n=1 Tax=Danaus plexippus TaxID=13037 RepID=UPI002AB060A5|nr:uncharacterized protein LOC116777785 isoform X3 [Danaus plexippus]